MKKNLIRTGLVVVIALTILVGLWSPWDFRVSVSRNTVAVGSAVVQAAELTDHLVDGGYFYLSTIKGKGTRLDPFKPIVSSFTDDWSMIDLRPDATKPDGYAVVRSSDLITGQANIFLLAEGLDGKISPAMLSSVKALYSATDVKADTVPGLLFELLTSTQRPNLTKPIVPDKDGEIRISCGGQIYGPAISVHGGTITESFNKANSSTLGPDHTWGEPDGTAWAVNSNQAYLIGNYQESCYISDYSMTDDDHYGQVVLKALNPSGSDNVYLAVQIRYNGAALASANLYALEAYDEYSGSRVKGYNLVKVVSGSYSVIDTDAQDPAADDVMYVEAVGSAIAGEVNGTPIVSTTDTSISGSGNRRVGLHYDGFNSSEYVRADSYEASELVATPDISVSPDSKAFGTVAGGTRHYTSGSEPSWPLTDGDAFFTLSNVGSIAVDITIESTDFDGGSGWNLVATAPGIGEARILAWKEGDGSGDYVTVANSPTSFITSLSASSDIDMELAFDFTSTTDKYEHSCNITLEASAS